MMQLVKESGPAHMRTYVTQCRCGHLTTEGDGSSKKLSKKRSAEKMVVELKQLPPLSPPPPNNRPKKIATKQKQTKNLIKATTTTHILVTLLLFSATLSFSLNIINVTFKLCLITSKTLHIAHPPYLSELITHCLPSRDLRFSNTNLLARLSGITGNLTSQAFSVSAPPATHCLHTSAVLINYQP